MELNLSPDIRNARLQVIVDALDSGAGAGKFLLYTGPKPDPGAAITTQTLLGTCVLSDPAGTISGGELTFAPITDDIAADADGDIVWARGVNSDNVWGLDMDVGNAASDAVLKFNTVTARAGGVIQILSGALTEGNA